MDEKGVIKRVGPTVVNVIKLWTCGPTVVKSEKTMDEKV